MNRRPAKVAAGFTLVELMIAMLLGLIVIAGVTSVFLANQQVYRSTSALSDVQENSRMSFEMLADNIREAGLLGCSNNGQVANVLYDNPLNGGTDWWANWSNALVGYGTGTAANPALTVGTAATNQVKGTDSLMILSAADIGLTVNTHSPTANTISLNGTSTDLATGTIANTIMIVCDPWQATIFQPTSYAAGTNPVVGYAVGSKTNCSTGLGYPTVCTAGGNSYTFAANSPIATLSAGVWYVGYNSVGGGSTSLYLATRSTATGTVTPQEMVRGVTAMSITYNMANATSFVTAANVTSWSSVVAVQVNLTVQQANGAANAGTYTGASTTAAAPIQRSYVFTSTVRNRVQ